MLLAVKIDCVEWHIIFDRTPQARVNPDAIPRGIRPEIYNSVNNFDASLPNFVVLLGRILAFCGLSPRTIIKVIASLIAARFFTCGFNAYWKIVFLGDLHFFLFSLICKLTWPGVTFSYVKFKILPLPLNVIHLLHLIFWYSFNLTPVFRTT